MSSDPQRVPYAQIPRDVRALLDEVYEPLGVEIFWNARNRIFGCAPKDAPLEDVKAWANQIADGNFA